MSGVGRVLSGRVQGSLRGGGVECQKCARCQDCKVNVVKCLSVLGPALCHARVVAEVGLP